ncbi:MAG TPA: hypothetical protein VFU41_11395 [Gemmatimonadales bacterium]|nr:hypothetical protein [Gemmatimonadales bacterium]
MGSRTTRFVIHAFAALTLVVPSRAIAAQAKRPPAPWAPHRTIAVGATLQDTLAEHDVLLAADSTYAQEWRLAGTAGATVTIDVVSEAFDAYEFLFGPGLEGEVPQDDDSGGRCNARLTVRLPQGGDYYVVVTSRNRRATGPFTLSVTAGPKPKSLARCDR